MPYLDINYDYTRYPSLKLTLEQHKNNYLLCAIKWDGKNVPITIENEDNICLYKMFKRIKKLLRRFDGIWDIPEHLIPRYSIVPY